MICVILYCNSLSGDAPPIEADEHFSETHQSAVDLLSQQSVVYEQEEHALRVLMEEELNEKMAREKERAGEVPTRLATLWIVYMYMHVHVHTWRA